ncbi:MAG TPA: GNAT family N-acetyltransferase [Solirubrobacteraceae bacterium]|jgi:RimJ/RimL family protein N-acetyltransferase|nr:GNAT family N-acetyltransferase [Solirubrobacteraceae bacterium]
MAPILMPGAPLRDGPTALRTWRDQDIPALVVACQDPDITRWTRVPSPYGEAEARAYRMTREAAVRAGAMAPFAIVEADAPDVLLGSISLMRFAWQDARGEVGYWLAAAARGRGHATRAVRLICAWGFHQLGLERIELIAATGNAASQTVAERTGFTREAVLRSHTLGAQGRQDMVGFALLRGDRPV